MVTGGLKTAIEGARGVRRDALVAVKAALDAADPALLVRRAVKVRGGSLEVGGVARDLAHFRKVVVVGGGKASGLMAAELERMLGWRVDRGVVVVPDYQTFLPKLERIQFAMSTHPLPSVKGLRGVKRMLHALNGVAEGDLVIALLSGGGSALMPAPPEGLAMGELERTTGLLLKAGAAIGEVNCVRKHLSQIAGGRLVEATGGAQVIGLIISDVVGDDLSSVASGPTVADPTTFVDAAKVLKARRVWQKVPASVRELITSGTVGAISETPKPGDPIFRNVANFLVGTNSAACIAAKASLQSSGYRVRLAGAVTGEARVVGARLARQALSRPGRHTAEVWGGETTVTVRGSGKGGRNQELALAAAIRLEGTSGVAVVSFGTDGVDGSTKAAGAYADSTTVERARELGLDPRRHLGDNDSNPFFEALGDLVMTGPTGTNVNDVMIAIRA
ncbi:MAG: glycerate kinase [Nitrososphaerota archaeon]|nr:glycerate kinase [Nitrososphaerota archaeon]